MTPVIIDSLSIGPGHPLAVFAGPCVIESREQILKTAEALARLAEEVEMPLIFKASFDKANRSSIHSFRGPGLEEGLAILAEVKKEFKLPLVTDIHLPEQAPAIAEVCDVIQIPAFLCRQTDLICAAAKTGAVVKVKKGQFMAPWDMQQVVTKIHESGNQRILLTDRGTSFGYNNLVSDMRAIPIMQSLGHPVCFDASHSVMLPGGHGECSGGQRQFIPTLARAAVAAGADSLFIETHLNPAEAKSDRDTQYPVDQLGALYRLLKNMRDLIVNS